LGARLKGTVLLAHSKLGLEQEEKVTHCVKLLVAIAFTAFALPASAENQVLKSTAVGAGVGMLTGVGAGTGAVAGAVVGGVKKHNDKQDEQKDN
jgi:hypothetical protein